MKNHIQLYFRYIRLHLRSELQYRGWPLMILQTILVTVTDPIGTILLFLRFGSVGAWSMERILCVYAIAVTSFGIAETFCRGFDYFPWKMIRTGGFDRLLVRPRPLALQAAASFFHLNRAARILSGLSAVAWTLWAQGIRVTPARILLLAGALAGGAVTYAGVFIFTSGIAFFTIQGLDWIFILTNVSYQVTRCPVDYLPRLLYGLFTFAVPVLVFSYYPASVLCGWGEPLWKGCLALPAGLCFLFAAMAVWRVGVRRYRSAGS